MPTSKDHPTPEADLLASIREDLGKDGGFEIYWGDDEDHIPDRLPCGIREIDEALSGGISMNRIALFVGNEGAGKTLLAQIFMKAAQAKGMPTVFLDIERTWLAEWATAVGVDPSKVIVLEPVDGEKAFDLARSIVSTEPPGVLVIDSIAAMPPAAELEADAGKQFMGTQARMVNRGLRDIVAANHGGWAVILINQIREKVGLIFGSPETLPGGKGQNFYAWQILRVSKGAAIEEGTKDAKKLIGREVRIRVDKNKQGPPGGRAEVPFYFTGEFDLVSGTLSFAVDLGIISANGGYYAYQDHKWHGKKGMRDSVAADPELLAELEAAIQEVPSIDD